jgi:hypothetical protein
VRPLQRGRRRCLVRLSGGVAVVEPQMSGGGLGLVEDSTALYDSGLPTVGRGGGLALMEAALGSGVRMGAPRGGLVPIEAALGSGVRIASTGGELPICCVVTVSWSICLQTPPHIGDL